MASISGSVTIAGDPDDWIACAFDAETHAFAGVAAVASGTYSISGLTAGRAYVVACRPKSGPAWAASRVTAENDYTVPTDPETTPYIFQATSTAGGDVYYGNVSALLNFNGANNSTTFTDETGKTWTPAGNAKISTAESVFGGASGYFDGTGDAISTPVNTAFQYGTGDFTIETWIRPTSDAANMDFMAHRNLADNNNFWFIRRTTAGAIRFYNKVTGSVIWDITTTGDTAGINAWTHIACVRNGTAINVYIDGTSRGSATSSSAMAYPNYNLLMGAADNGLAGGMVGYMDDARLTKGIARYTGTFTPPAAEMPNYAAAQTGSTEPTWPTTPGNTIADGDVTWTNMGQLLDPLIAGPLIAV